MRFDDSGRLTASLKMIDNTALLFFTDGSAATVDYRRPPRLIVEDRQGRRQVVAALPQDSSLRYRLDDGSWVLFDKTNHELVVSADGRRAVYIERDIRYETVLADGAILAALCRDPDNCATRDLTLHRRPW